MSKSAEGVLLPQGTAAVNNDNNNNNDDCRRCCADQMSVAAACTNATRYTDSLHFALLMRSHLVESSDSNSYVLSYYVPV